MNYTKRIVGWLCLLSLVTSVFFLGYWAYLKTSPFFHGAYIVHYYDWFDKPELLIDEIARDGVIDSSDGEALKRYSMEGSRRSKETGILAAVQYLFDGTPESAYPGIFVIASLQDADRSVVAAYPPSYLPRIPVYRGNGEVWRAAYQDLTHQVSGWSGNNPEMYEVRDPSGKYIGILGVVRTSRSTVAYIPDDARSASNASLPTYLILSLGFLLLHLLLLPVWTGMDAAWRGMRPFPWGLLVLLTSYLGFLAYWIAKLPSPQPCSNCGELVVSKYKRCPSCGTTLIARCPTCKTKLKPGWQYCPVCSVVPSESSLEPEVVEEVSAKGSEDELYEASVRLVVAKGMASTSMLQRQFKIGYTRAAAILDAMEEQGIVGPLEGAHPRKVLILAEDLDKLFPDSVNTHQAVSTVSYGTKTDTTAAIDDADYANLSIKVTNALTSAPLADSKVRMQGPSVIDGLTNSAGIFQANRLKKGQYSITISKQWYEPYLVDMAVNGETGLSDLKVRLKPLPGSIKGRVVVLGSGEPVPGAKVTLDSSRVDYSTITGASGEYRFDDITPGPYTFRVEAAGLTDQTKVEEIISGREVRVDFSLESSGNQETV